MKKFALFILIIILVQTVQSQKLIDWQSSGITSVQGTIDNFEKYLQDHSNIEIFVDDWTNASRRTYFAKIDNNGKFSVSFFVFNAQQVLLFYKNNLSGIFVSPDDTLSVLFDADKFPENIKYIGKTSTTNKIMDDYSSFWQDSISTLSRSRLNNILKDSLPYENYVSWRDSLYHVEMNMTNTYLNQMPNEAFFVKWATTRNLVSLLRDIARFKAPDLTYAEDRIQSLFKVINTLKLDTVSDNLSITPNYNQMINRLYLTVSEIGFYLEMQNQIETTTNLKNQSDIKSRTITVRKSPSERAIEQAPYYFEASKLIQNTQIRESVLAHYYTNVLEKQNIDLGLDTLLAQITDDKIKTSLININNSYRWRKTNQNALNVTNGSPSLLDELKEKYKGYVLYIDFWGTWCGPCYDGFKYMPNIKKSLENQKVAFVYLCCHCNKEKWEKDIKDYSIEGENILLTSDQYAYLAKQFNLIGVPRYVIIDKNGRIVNDNAPRPSSLAPLQEKLINELAKYSNMDN